MWSLPDSDPFCVSSGAKIFATAESQFNNVTMNTPLNPNKALWEKGDFARIADTMRESGEALVRQLGITTGLRVLDLVCRLLLEKKKTSPRSPNVMSCRRMG